MEAMVATKKLDRILEEMKAASKREFQLYDAEGTLLSATAEEDAKESVILFATSMAETQIVQNWIYFRVELQGETQYVLLCSKGTEEDQSYVIGKMALCQIRNLFRSVYEPENRLMGLRQIINGEITGEKLSETCHQLQLKSGNFAVYVIQYKDEETAILLETLRNLFVNSYTDLLVEMDGTKSVLLKPVGDIPSGNFEQYARVIVDNVEAEVMQNVWVGYGDPIVSYAQVHRAYKNASTALQFGRTYYGKERVFYYEQLGIGRLIYKRPQDLCELFLKEVLGENMDLGFDEETMTTINKLFENNLNISETARQLYIHRNTLVYRLERIEKRIGLDIRSFEDAMLFKIAMMVQVHLKELSVVKSEGNVLY